MRHLVALVATLLCTSNTVLAQDSGVFVDGERLPVVDVHLHTGTWELMTPWFQERISERAPRGFKWTVGLLSDRWLSADGILKELDKAGIEAGGVFALFSPHTAGIASNEFVAEQIAQSDRLFGFASPRVDQWNVYAEEELSRLEEVLQRPGFIGVKLAHAHLQMRFDDIRFDSIYALAGRLGKPVYLHTATSPNPGTRLEPPYTDPLYLEATIRDHPETIFILGHAGWDSHYRKLTYTDSCIDLAKRYSNVYLEPGALGAKRAAEVLPDFVARIKAADVIEKLIYGSDGPQNPGYVKLHLDNFVAAMVDAGYTKDEMGDVLAGNFRRVFADAGL